jgi:hypothetical protein
MHCHINKCNSFSQAAQDYQALPGISPLMIREANLHHSCSVVGHLYYSKAFPLTFSDFCNRIADCIAEVEVVGREWRFFFLVILGHQHMEDDYMKRMMILLPFVILRHQHGRL